MQLARRPIAIATTVTGALILLVSTLRTQPLPAVGPVWEYVTVTNSAVGGTETCFAAASGCKYEREAGRSSESVASAAARLGEKGWELAAAADLQNGKGTVLYFKRLKSVINRGESAANR